MTRTLLALAFAVLAAAAFACRREPTAQDLAEGPDPLGSLVAPVTSSRYNLPFWVREERAQSRLWATASAACLGKPESLFPNCGFLRIASYWGRPPALAAPAPAPLSLVVPRAEARP